MSVVNPLDNLTVSTIPSTGYITASCDTFSISNEASFNGTIKADSIILDGVDIGKTIAAIQERLLILTPDPAKLEKYEALKKAYEHYKLLEALLNENE